MAEANIKNNWVKIVENLTAWKTDSIELSHSFYRYMSEEDLDYILGGSFQFKNPSSWWDPFESLMVNGDYSKLGFSKPATYVACFSKLARSEAHWKMYKRNLRKPCIRVEFDMMNFIRAFCLADVLEHQSHIYIGDVYYGLRERSILAIGKKTSKYHKVAIPSNFVEKDYVDLLLLKRQSFKWEQETRIIVLRENEEQQPKFHLRYDPKMAKSFIRSIQIEPKRSNKQFYRLRKKYQEKWDSLGQPLYSKEFNCTKSNLYSKIEPLVFER